ncbi:hypothetical protein [Paraliobacillus sp. JSM ZJ581]|uniref:hypothetical protein n=1 Tax=Paraliobacillus sp. JSM ZJ581 TaxID=3342118 RepID=UPI0035A9A1BF
MILAYSLYTVSFAGAFLVSYYYINYATEHALIRLYANIIVASVMQLSIYSLSVFGWLLYTFQEKEAHFYIGLQLGFWLVLISQLGLIGLALYKFKKAETIQLAQNAWRTSKEKFLKIHKNIRSFSKAQTKN